MFSCSKIETFGTLRVTVEAEEQRKFTLYVYPYSDYDNQLIIEYLYLKRNTTARK